MPTTLEWKSPATGSRIAYGLIDFNGSEGKLLYLSDSYLSARQFRTRLMQNGHDGRLKILPIGCT